MKIYWNGHSKNIIGSRLKELAYQQQTINQILSPKRGNIYDSTGKALAISAQVDTITINPAKIVGDTDEETKKLKETVAKGLSDIFSLDYNETFEKVNNVKVPYKIVDRRPGDIAACYADPAKAYKELGFKAEYGIEDMCRDSYNYILNNKESHE